MYQGVLCPDTVLQVRRARIDSDRQAFRLHLLRLAQELQDAGQVADEPAAQDGQPRRLPFELKTVESSEHPDGFAFELQLDGKPIAPPEHVRGTMASILQDLGEIPEDYLYAAGDGAYEAAAPGAQSADDVWKGTYHEEGAFLYNEWDYERQNYRKNWAVLRELEVSPADAGFVRDTL